MGEMLATVSGDVGNLLPAKRAKSSSATATKSFHTSLHFSTISQESGASENVANNLLSAFDFSNGSKTLFYMEDGQEITYGQFDRSINRYANYLRKKFKVRKGDRVAAQVNKSPNSLALYFATLRLGGVFVPLNTDYKKDEIRYFLLNAEPSLFVCRAADFQVYQSLLANGSSKSASIKCSLINEQELADGVQKLDDQGPISIEKVSVDDLAAICYTSGTTGQPKGAMITHGNLASNGRTLCQIWKISQDDILLHSMPIYHVHGLFVATNTTLIKGASMYFLSRFEVDTVLRVLPKCTIMMGVPTYYTRLLHSQQFTKELVAHIRLFVSGSAPLLEGTWREFKERTGKEILERYGMTEGQMICSNPYDGERIPGTVGPALPGISVRVRNGGLEYKGPNVFKGYWRMPEKTKEEFTDDGYFISGDVAEMGSDGYLRILGRGKDLIITGGLNVYPKEIENAIDALPGVVESAVIGVPHPDFGESVVAVVVRQNSQEKMDDKESELEMIKVLKDRIAAFKVPKRVFLQNQLPRNVMGKVQKNVLRDMYKNAFSK